MNILVLGASGMAGHMISTYLKEKGYTVSTLSGHTQFDLETVILDVQNTKLLSEYLRSHKFDLVINCIGLLIKDCEENKAKAVLVNAYLPHFLENFYKDSQTKVIQLSTDCVFSGKHPPYYENTLPDGELFYDRVKSIGELRNEKDLTFRMSIIGPDRNQNGIGLFNWFMAQTKSIYGYGNVFWNGITTLELAKAIEFSITCNITGLYHLVPKESISKYNLLLLCKEVFQKNSLLIFPIKVQNSNKQLVNTRTDFSYQVSNYKTMMIDMKQWIDDHSALYSHYYN
ncbi:MAG: sugar nucleotide-binding protein [Velocimicrobium sp.]